MQTIKNIVSAPSLMPLGPTCRWRGLTDRRCLPSDPHHLAWQPHPDRPHLRLRGRYRSHSGSRGGHKGKKGRRRHGLRDVILVGRCRQDPDECATSVRQASCWLVIVRLGVRGEDCAASQLLWLGAHEEFCLLCTRPALTSGRAVGTLTRRTLMAAAPTAAGVTAAARAA